MSLRSIMFGVAVALAPVAASASSILQVVGGTPGAIPSNFNPSGSSVWLGLNDPISVYSAPSGSAVTGGLYLAGPAEVTFTFLGKEAGARNSFSAGNQTLSNRGAVGAAFTQQFSSGILDFSFSTIMGGQELAIENGGTSDFKRLSFALSSVFNDGYSILALFGDGRGDSDFDDMIVQIDVARDIAVTPLPAGAALLLTGIGGFAAFRRRRA